MRYWPVLFALAAAGALWWFIRDLDPEPIVGEIAAPVMPADPVLDLELPTDSDYEFLQQVLREGSEPARVSAARALLAINSERSQWILLERAREGDKVAFVAALEMLRFQRREDALSTIREVREDPSYTDEMREMAAYYQSLLDDRPGDR